MANPLASENIWFGKYQCEDAERAYYERLSGVLPTPVAQCTQKNEKPANNKNERKQVKKCMNDVKPPSSDLVNQIAKARQQIQKSLDNPESTSAIGGEIRDRIAKLEQDKENLNKVTDDLQAMVKRLENRIASLESGDGSQEKKEESKPAPADDDDDEDIDLFGSDSEDDEAAEKLKEERVKQYQEKKSTKKAIIAKSSVVIDVKTWGDEVDMKEMEALVRGIEMDGLVWGASKVLPVAFGVKKLQIIIVIEDDKVSTEDLQEQIESFEDHVQSTDIVAFNKI